MASWCFRRVSCSHRWSHQEINKILYPGYAGIQIGGKSAVEFGRDHHCSSIGEIVAVFSSWTVLENFLHVSQLETFDPVPIPTAELMFLLGAFPIRRLSPPSSDLCFVSQELVEYQGCGVVPVRYSSRLLWHGRRLVEGRRECVMCQIVPALFLATVFREPLCILGESL